jgi:hypothetical protein
VTLHLFLFIFDERNKEKEKFRNLHKKPEQHSKCDVITSMVKAHDRGVLGSNPGTVYWMDVSKQFASYYILEKLKIKVAKWGTPKKINIKKAKKKVWT